MRTASHEWSLWSTRARLVVTDSRLLDEAVARTRLLLAEVDDAANRFRDDSEISRLRAGTTRVSPLFADLLRAALDSARTSDGAVDPTVGGALVALGYDRTLPAIDQAGRLPRVALPAPGWESVVLEDGAVTIPDGCRLDLGATAKAVAADLVARVVHGTLGCGVLVSLGGDIATAGTGPIGGWQVRVHDHLDDPDAHVTLGDGWALATSSTVRRTWRLAGESLHHVVDPATGRPATPTWRTVTVAAPSCLEANTASTAAVVKGPAGVPWLRGQGVAARLVGARGEVELVGSWPAERAVA